MKVTGQQIKDYISKEYPSLNTLEFAREFDIPYSTVSTATRRGYTREPENRSMAVLVRAILEDLKRSKKQAPVFDYSLDPQFHESVEALNKLKIAPKEETKQISRDSELAYKIEEAYIDGLRHGIELRDKWS